ncbi:carbohydrate binding family 9 domain-containing protein [Engelhardtia mirabilis]|uniref:carbohydrate binding family 9 domain-containing protein n=1 Tax=Engelhardtia mirabilis TaxID=2528011 RepID=UPI003AF33359
MDGRLDDPIWDLCHVIDEFVQVLPIEGGEPSQRTEVRVAYDEEAIYIGVACLDDRPDLIRGTQMARDAVLDPDDRVEILIDTFLTRRDAHWFQIGPAGGKGDALLTKNGSRFDKNWDGIFDAASTWTDEGWFCEFAIPYATTGFAPDAERWGFNVRRFIRRNSESVRWASPERRLGFFEANSAGFLDGVGGLEPVLGLDLKPFVVAGYSRDDESGDRDHSGDAGLDLFWRVRPQTKLALSLNTDFAETEVDARQVNLTRFPLFFPEKRDFFLEDSGAFFFGPPGAGQSGSDLIPFFSRRIGLDADGSETPILAAAKLTSRGDGYTVGVLDVQTGDAGDLDGQNLSVARASFDLFEQSDVGGIVTWGDPAGDGRAVTYGADLNLRTDDFLGDRSLRFSSYVVGTDNEDGGGAANAVLFELDYPNDEIQLETKYVEIGADLDPRLGFVPRTDIRRWAGTYKWEPRINGTIRALEFAIDPSIVTDREGNTESERLRLQPLEIDLESGDELSLSAIREREVLDEDFEIADGVTIPAGDYDWWRYSASLASSDKREVSGTLSLVLGDFYEGDRLDLSTGIEWRPNRYITLDLDYVYREVDLPQGAFDVHLGRARIDWTFTPQLAWSIFAQYDNGSRLVGLNSRLRWIIEPGSEAFFVLNQDWEATGGDYAPRDSAIAGKLGWTFRF